MIKIDKEKKEIHFIPEQTGEDCPPERRFPLLSGYVCPFCKKILAAYFQGQMSEAEILFYKDEKPRYVIGSVGGGHYVKVENHEGYYNDPDRCSWEIFSKRGVVENLRVFAKEHEVPLLIVKRLAEKIGSIPGFCVVRDVCERDGEMVLFLEERMLKELREKEGFEAYWKAKGEVGEFLKGCL